MEGFYLHVKEAIEINSIRRKQYSVLSNKKTLFLSNLLILSEKFTLIMAKNFDKKAIPFNKRGINIVKNDFVPMDIPTYDHKVDRQNAFTKVIKSDVSKRMNTYAKGLNGKGWDESKLLEVGDFGKKLYDNILNIESTSSVNFPMCKHMIESVVFIARNGIDYAKQSNNETLNLSQDLVKIHKMALQMSMFVDSNANKFHQNNIGIILNDLPHIQI